MYPGAKVYYDGSHYIAIPYEPKPKKRKIYKKVPPSDLFELIRNKEKEISLEQRETEAKKAYDELSNLKGQERVDAAVEKLKEKCIPLEEARALVEKEKERRQRRISEKKKRFYRKAFLNEFNYFVTFTYDDKKRTEESFKKGLIVKLCKLKKKYGWKYAGVWEESPNDRVHFHGLLYVPEGTMIGSIEKRRDFTVKLQRMHEYYVNTYFEKEFGRNEFSELSQNPMAYEIAMKYILKYISKTDAKFIYSRNLPMYLISDINEDDELGRIGVDDRKIVLPDDFECWDEGEYLGTMSKEVKAKMRTISS